MGLGRRTQEVAHDLCPSQSKPLCRPWPIPSNALSADRGRLRRGRSSQTRAGASKELGPRRRCFRPSPSAAGFRLQSRNGSFPTQLREELSPAGQHRVPPKPAKTRPLSRSAPRNAGCSARRSAATMTGAYERRCRRLQHGKSRRRPERASLAVAAPERRRRRKQAHQSWKRHPALYGQRCPSPPRAG